MSEPSPKQQTQPLQRRFLHRVVSGHHEHEQAAWRSIQKERLTPHIDFYARHLCAASHSRYITKTCDIA
jgi:hypothetical protein